MIQTIDWGSLALLVPILIAAGFCTGFLAGLLGVGRVQARGQEVAESSVQDRPGTIEKIHDQSHQNQQGDAEGREQHPFHDAALHVALAAGDACRDVRGARRSELRGSGECHVSTPLALDEPNGHRGG